MFRDVEKMFAKSAEKFWKYETTSGWWSNRSSDKFEFFEIVMINRSNIDEITVIFVTERI